MMNNVTMVGRLTKDTQLQYLQSGTALAKFDIAVKRPFAKKDDEVKADFFNVSVFGKQAEACARYLAKGRLTAVKGRLQNNNYTDKDGIKRYSVNIIAEQVEFLDYGDKQSSAQSIGGVFEAIDSDDVPF